MGDSTTTTYTLAKVLQDITSIVSSMVDWMKSIVDAVTSNPLLLAFVLVSFIGIGITVFRRLTR